MCDEDVVRWMQDRQADMQEATLAGNSHEVARLCHVMGQVGRQSPSRLRWHPTQSGDEASSDIRLPGRQGRRGWSPVCFTGSASAGTKLLGMSCHGSQETSVMMINHWCQSVWTVSKLTRGVGHARGLSWTAPVANPRQTVTTNQCGRWCIDVQRAKECFSQRKPCSGVRRSEAEHEAVQRVANHQSWRQSGNWLWRTT